jgi:hypothetical protein
MRVFMSYLISRRPPYNTSMTLICQIEAADSFWSRITWIRNGKELENKRAHESKNVPISLYRKFEFHPDQDTPMKKGNLLKGIDNKTV